MAETKQKEGQDKAAQKLEEMIAAGGKSKRKKKKIIIIVCAALALLMVLKSVFSGGKAAQGTGYIDYAAERRDLVISVSDSGALQPADSYNIVGLVGGDVLAADFEEGDYVEKDTLLYQIDSSDAEKSIEQARISLENAGLTYQNVVDGLDGLSPKSSVAGRVTKLYVRAGDEVQTGSPLADIADTDNMVLELGFHQSDAQNIYVGDSAEVTLGTTGEKLTGSVTAVSRAVDHGNGNVLLNNIEITVSNPGGLQAGTYATAVIKGFNCAASGQFEPKTQTKVVSMAGGTVGRLLVSEGDRVSKDQALMTIDSDSAQRQIRGADLGVRSAQLSLDNAMDIMDKYSIKAPISGTVVEKKIKAGDRLDNTSASVLAVIYDMSYLSLNLDIDELDIGSIKAGQKVSIEADALPGKTFEGYVDRVGVNGTSTAGVTTYPVRVIVENYEDLLPGMNVTAEVIIEKAENVLTVPISAVGRGNVVLVADPSSKGDMKNGVPAGYRQVEVKVGRTTDDYIEILEGINEGDIVGVSTSTSSLMEMMMGGPGGGGGEVQVAAEPPRD